MTTKDTIKAILGFLAVAIAAYALIVTIVSCFNYAFTAGEGFRAVCGGYHGCVGRLRSLQGQQVVYEAIYVGRE